MGLEEGLLSQEQRSIELTLQGRLQLRVLGAELGPEVFAILADYGLNGQNRVEWPG